jgi:site-specific DNA-methyltransferase (adenine-specific)
VNFESRRAETADGKRFVKAIDNDGDLETAIELFHDVMIPLMEDKAADECEVYVFTRWDIVGEWINAVRYMEPLMRYKMLLVWDKGVPGMGDIDANWGCGHELILYCKKGKRDVHHRRSAILHYDKLGSKQHVHPTEKPVGLMSALIEMSTDPGDLVVDPFAGSGASMVAAQEMSRKGVAFEQELQYVDVIKQRLSQATLF